MAGDTHIPILQSMLTKLLEKGNKVSVVETHPVYCGNVLTCDTGMSTAVAVQIIIQREDGKKASFNIHQPERWKLGKNDAGEWTLWPPRARSRRQLSSTR